MKLQNKERAVTAQVRRKDRKKEKKSKGRNLTLAFENFCKFFFSLNIQMMRLERSKVARRDASMRGTRQSQEGK